MKNSLKLSAILFLLFSSNLLSQVIISPYIVYMDDKDRYGSMIVQNESYEPYEISISFVFGYPVSDSLGNRTMKYIQYPDENVPSINNWVKAFPKKFVLQPKERQTIRLMSRPPTDLLPGTYWTRIVTSSSPVETSVDTSTSGVSAKLKFVLNQVTTAIYRKEPANVDLKIDEPKIYLDSTNTYQLLFPLQREGNSPFFGNLSLRVFNAQNELVHDEKEYLSIYFDLVRNFILPKEKFIQGKYHAELEVKFNEKEDISESKMEQKPNVIKKFDFSIP